MEINFNWRINVRIEYQGNTEMYFCLFVLSVYNTPDTTHFSPIYGYTYIDSYLLRLQEKAVYTSLTYLFWFNCCELLPLYFTICIYVYACTSIHLKFWACMCLSTPTSLCLSTYGFLYVPAATALSKGHKPLPEMGHFLLEDKLCTVSLQGVCKRRSTVHKHEIVILKTYYKLKIYEII